MGKQLKYLKYYKIVRSCQDRRMPRHVMLRTWGQILYVSFFIVLYVLRVQRKITSNRRKRPVASSHV